MFFNKDKGFFLTLDQNAESVKLAIPESLQSSETTSSETASSDTASTEASPAEEATSEPMVQSTKHTEVVSSAQPVMTTAQAIAAELAAAEASRPPVSMSTFAPGNLVAGSGLLMKKRRPGAAMKGFRSIASDLFRS